MVLAACLKGKHSKVVADLKGINTHSCRWKKAMDAVHRAKLLLLLADFAGVQSAVPAIVARYKVIIQI